MPMSASKKSKTSRFPVARIKKIMQMDEEVGKLASATPVMISKSLECFLQLLIDEAAKETRQRGSKKMTASHLKQAVISQPNFDFLLPLTASIPDPAPTEDKPTKVRKPADPNSTRKRRKGAQHPGEGEGELEGNGHGHGGNEDDPSINPVTLPSIGTWRRDAVGGGGSGEGGRGIFDDYEDDDDDY